MTRKTYRRCLFLTLGASVALVVLPIVATVVYYAFALKRELHPDGGPGFFHFLAFAAEDTLPFARVAMTFTTVGACLLPISLILLVANIISGNVERIRNCEEPAA